MKARLKQNNGTVCATERIDASKLTFRIIEEQTWCFIDPTAPITYGPYSSTKQRCGNSSTYCRSRHYLLASRILLISLNKNKLMQSLKTFTCPEVLASQTLFVLNMTLLLLPTITGPLLPIMLNPRQIPTTCLSRLSHLHHPHSFVTQPGNAFLPYITLCT